jgi:hypothetical protein
MMYQASSAVRADVQFHPEIPLIPFLGRMHLI